jgi:uncharacterized membrane protein
VTQLLFLLLLLTGPYLLLSLAERRISGFTVPAHTRRRIGLSLFFLFTGMGHFLQSGAMAQMLPPFVPFRLELIYVTGILEWLGAVGLWIPRLITTTGVCLIVMLIGVLPANVYAAFNRVDFGGHDLGPAYLLVRVPFQFFVIWWIYKAAVQTRGATPADGMGASGRPSPA